MNEKVIDVTEIDVRKAFFELSGGPYYIDILGDNLLKRFVGKKDPKILYKEWILTSEDFERGKDRISGKTFTPDIFVRRVMQSCMTFKHCWQNLPEHFLSEIIRLFPDYYVNLE